MNKKTALVIVVIVVLLLIAFFAIGYSKDVTNLVYETASSTSATIASSSTSTLQTPDSTNSSTTQTAGLTMGSAMTNTQNEVSLSFEAYQRALLTKDGALAVNHIDQNSLNYYADILNLVKTGNKATIQKRNLMDQLTILMIRHRIAKQTLLNTKVGSELVDIAVDNGMIGEASVRAMSVNSVQVNGNTALVEIKNNQGVVIPQKFTFRNEKGAWKLDLTSLFPMADVAFRYIADRSGMTHEDFIFQILESLTGIKPTQDIWKPLV